MIAVDVGNWLTILQGWCFLDRVHHSSQTSTGEPSLEHSYDLVITFNTDFHKAS